MARTIPSQALQVSVSLGHVFEIHSVAEPLHERHLKQNVFHQFKLLYHLRQNACQMLQDPLSI